MDLYRTTFAGLLLINGIALYRLNHSKNASPTESSPDSSDKVEHRGRGEEEDEERVKGLKWRFLPVYLLVSGADWLQGPYIYPIYKGISSMDARGRGSMLIPAR